MIDINQNKKKFLQILRSTNRKYISRVIDYLDNTDFYTSPASTKYHGNYEGGLCEHSLNVYEQAMYLYNVEKKIKKDISKYITEDNVIIASLLHDVCKISSYKTVEKWKKDSDNNWVKYQTYEHDYSNLPLGHGEKSLVRIMRTGFELKECEMLAIRWHMSAFDLSDSFDAKKSFDEASNQTPLVPIISCADVLAARITEAGLWLI